MERKTSRIQEKSKTNDSPASSSIGKERKKPQRPLNEEEKKQLRSFLIDLENYYMEIAPEITDPIHIWQIILEDLRKIFRITKDLFNDSVKGEKSEETKDKVIKEIIKMEWKEKYKNYYDGDLLIEWRKIILYLFKNEMPNIDPTINYFKSIHEDRIKNLRYADVIHDANLRLQILKHLTIKEYMKTIKKTMLEKLTHEEKWDLIMLLNDPTSKIFESLLQMVRDKEFENVKYIIEHEATVIDQSGNIINSVSFNINTCGKDGITVLIACISVGLNIFYEIDDYIDFMEFIINIKSINLTIPCTVKIGEDTILKGNAFSYALYGYYYGITYYRIDNCCMKVYMYMLNYDTPIYINKIPQFYVEFKDEPSKCKGKYFGIVYKTLKSYDETKENYIRTICIDNVWILFNVTFELAKEFIKKGGLDISEGYNGRDIRASLVDYTTNIKADASFMQKSSVIDTSIIKDIKMSEVREKELRKFLPYTINVNTLSTSFSSAGGRENKRNQKKQKEKTRKTSK